MASSVQPKKVRFAKTSTPSSSSIAVFGFDEVSFTLKDPRVIRLGSSFVLKTNSELWEKSMTAGHRHLPSKSICLVENGSGGHTLLFPDGVDSLVVIVDRQRHEDSSGRQLTGGELVRVYHKPRYSPLLGRTITRQEIEALESLLRENISGPLIFQYQAKGHVEGTAVPSTPAPGSASVRLDQLPLEVLQMIFSHLPADETLHNIPAVCSKFLDAVRNKAPFENGRWEIGGSLHLGQQEVEFLQGWTLRPVSHLKLTTLDCCCRDRHTLKGVHMESSRNSVTSVEIDVRGLEALLMTDGSLVYSCFDDADLAFKVSSLNDQINRSFTGLKCLKLRGVPITSSLDRTLESISRFGRNLERLWIGFKRQKEGSSYSWPLWSQAPSWMNNAPPKLKVATFRFELASINEVTGLPALPEGNCCIADLSDCDLIVMMESTPSSGCAHTAGSRNTGQVTPVLPCNLETLFSCFCPAEASSINCQRRLILDCKGNAWKTCIRMLGQLQNGLHGLSLSVDSHLARGEVRSLIGSFPSSLQVLHLVMDQRQLTDELCLTIAVQCPELEIFCWQPAEGHALTQRGIRALTVGCENLKRIFLLQRDDNNGVWAPRADILPERFKNSSLKNYEEELRHVFD